jgi:glutathione S-transferase
MLKLYYAPGSCALASHIALEEAGANYRAEVVDFANNAQQAPDYLAINPKGRVPALVTPEGVLTETPAVLVYIAQSFPERRLAPLDDIWAFAQFQSFNSFICSTVHVNFAHLTRGYRWADEKASLEDMTRKTPETMAAAFDLIEHDFLKGPWVMGEDYSLADGYLLTVTRWLYRAGVDPDRHPRVAEHFKRTSERPAVATVLESH